MAHTADSEVDAERVGSARASRDRILTEIRKVIIGQEDLIDRVLVALFAGGHVLLVGVPGLAKTLLVSTLAKTLSCGFRRIQFTPDMMPSDITGTDVLEEDHATGRKQFVAYLAELGKRYPDTTFILAHSGHMWVKSFQAAKPYPNLYFDVSGFDPERGVVERAVEYLGAERILWGSDAPGRNYAAQLAKVQYADISERDKELILGGNAIRLLGL